MRKRLKGEKKTEWMEKIENEGRGCENKNNWTDKKRYGERERETYIGRECMKERQKQGDRDSLGNWPIFQMNAYERRTALHLRSGTTKKAQPK